MERTGNKDRAHTLAPSEGDSRCPLRIPYNRGPEFIFKDKTRPGGQETLNEIILYDIWTLKARGQKWICNKIESFSFETAAAAAAWYL